MTHRIGQTFSTLALGLVLATTALSGPLAGAARAAGASDTDQERAARWQEIAKSIFGDRQIAPTDSLVKIEAPARALDAALVPITLTMPNDGQIKAVSLIIDDNPAPYAAKFEFGPAADPAGSHDEHRIRSFHARRGRITQAQAAAIDRHWARWGVELDGSPLDLAALYGRAGMPVVLTRFAGPAIPVNELSHDYENPSSARMRYLLQAPLHRELRSQYEAALAQPDLLA